VAAVTQRPLVPRQVAPAIAQPLIRGPLLAVAVICGAAAVGLTVLIVDRPPIALDESVARTVQSVDFGPLTVLFPVFRWAGGPPGGPFVAAAAVGVALVLNRRAWLLALAIIAGSVWYPVLIFAIHRPRPLGGQVLRITEQPGGTSFPSGHVLFLAFDLAVLLLCAGYRYLPSWGRVIGWCVLAVIVLLVGISRVYVGAHWPTDVLAAMLIAAAWLALVLSIRLPERKRILNR
jgi:undecaprenyl-diphosphatase